MIRNDSFERLRDEVARDLRPVRPLRPPWRSALVVLPLVIFLLSVILVLYGLRSDADELGVWPVWGPAAAMVAVAYTLLVMALAQRTPGSRSTLGFLLLPFLAIAIQVGSAYATQLASESPPPAIAWTREAVCFGNIAFLGLPVVLFVFWLLSRGLPLRPRLAGLLGGLAGGVLAEGIYRLHCGLSHPGHIVPWHTGAVLVMALLGLLAGIGLERARLRRYMEQRS